jgi:hypothetical protein
MLPDEIPTMFREGLIEVGRTFVPINTMRDPSMRLNWESVQDIAVSMKKTFTVKASGFESENG